MGKSLNPQFVPIVIEASFLGNVHNWWKSKTEVFRINARYIEQGT